MEQSDLHMNRAAVDNLLTLFDNNQIRYSYAAAGQGKKFKAYDYYTNKNEELTIEKGDILVSAYQPQSHFIQALFEPQTKTTDSLSYDLSAWALPYVYNLKAFAVVDRISADTVKVVAEKQVNNVPEGKPYAYITNFTGFDELKLMADLYRKNIKLRYSLKPFTLNGITYNRGSLIIARGDNKSSEPGFDKKVIAAANACNVKLVPANTGLVESGKDFGSENSPLLKKRSAAMICGEGVSAGGVGEIWYFFEKELNYPLSLLNVSGVEKVDLKNYDVLILTSGNYSKLKDTIVDFVRRGGRVIALESAAAIFSGERTTSLARAVETRTSEQKLTEKKIRSDDTTLLKKFEVENEKRYILSERSAGSIYKVRLDDTNPYVFGMGKEWYVMKHSPGLPFLASGSNIGYITDREPVAGFAGFKYKDKIKNTIVIGSEKLGSGEVIYITDDPYFRAFWKTGRVLLGNAILR